MLTTKPVNPGQLQAEALAVTGNAHVALSLSGVALDGGGTAPAGATLMCSDGAGSSGLAEPCQWCVTAYNAHVARNTTAPSFALLPAAGNGATGSVLSGSSDTLMAGTIHAGSSPAAGDILAVTFGVVRATPPLIIQVGALNVQAGTLIAKNITTTGFTIATTAVPQAGNTYTLWAHVLG